MKAKDLLKNKEVWIIVILVLITSIPRLILIDLNKGLWWDEASFVVEAGDFIGEKPCDWEPHRLPGLPLLIAPLVRIFGVNLIVLRLLQLFLMIISVIFTFFFVKKLYNERIALASSILLSLAWLPLFYSLRILAHVPAMAFIISAIYFFLTGYEENKNSRLFISGILLGFCYLIRIEAIPCIISIVVFLLIDKKAKIFKEKKFYFLVIGFLIPFLLYQLWEYTQFGNFFYQEKLNYELTKEAKESYFTYFQMFPHIFTIPTLIFLSLGIIYLFLKIREKTNTFVFIMFWVFLFLVSFSPYHEDRYLIPILPIAFTISSLGINLLVSFVKQRNVKLLSCIAVSLLLSYFSLNYGLPIIYLKAPTYSVVIEAATYLKFYQPNRSVFVPFSVGAPHPEVCLFAGPRVYLPYPNNLTTLLQEAKEEQAIIYYAFPYDGDISYLSLRNFVENYTFNEYKYQKWLNETGLKIVKSFEEKETGAIVILYNIA